MSRLVHITCFWFQPPRSTSINLVSIQQCQREREIERGWGGEESECVRDTVSMCEGGRRDVWEGESVWESERDTHSVGGEHGGRRKSCIIHGDGHHLIHSTSPYRALNKTWGNVTWNSCLWVTDNLADRAGTSHCNNEWKDFVAACSVLYVSALA